MLFSLHGRVLVYIYRNPGRPADEIALGLGLNAGTIWPIIGDLRSRDMLTVERKRRRHYYSVKPDATLREPAIESVPLGRLLAGFARD